jgi:hypothetical protein
MRAVKSVVVYPVGSYARIFHASRSTMCKDHLPWMSLQLQVSQVDRVSFIRSYNRVHHNTFDSPHDAASCMPEVILGQ